MRALFIITGVIAALALCAGAYYLIGTHYLSPVVPEAAPSASTTETADNGSGAGGNNPAANQSSESDLTGSSWSWRYTDRSGGGRIDAPAGDRFVLSFDGNGRVTSTTDCNNLGGSVSIDGEVISMGQFISTLMYCEGSVESQYATDLGLVNSYVIDGDTLRFNLNRDYGTMFFTRFNR